LIEVDKANGIVFLMNKKVLSSQIPMTRLGAVDEIAQSVLFLAGESGSFTNTKILQGNVGLYTPQDQ